MKNVYKIYFEEVQENEEIGTVTNLDEAREFIKNDILERGFDIDSVEYQEDNYIISEEIK